jgi:diacylglycerol kinase (ATP)
MLKAFQHVVHAAGYSLAGLRHLLRTELAARIEVSLSVAALLWFLVLGRPFVEVLILVVLFCILMSVEAVNTAIERIVDHMSPDRTEFGRNAKDLGSTAVFFMLWASGLYVLAVTLDAAGLALW